MRQVYKDVITSPFRAPLPTDAESEARTETFLIELGIDPAHCQWLLAQGEYIDPDAHYQWLLTQEEFADCPPLEPLPESSPEEVAAIKEELMANAPKALFIADDGDPRDGMWLRWPSANRMVRPGAPRDGDPTSEALALHQASHHATRRRRRKGGYRT
jgi:hypothetical protein